VSRRWTRTSPGRPGDYAPRLRARLDVEQQLIDDATARGWQREIERHTATKTRIEQLLKDLRQ
jgi:hypothetical protein